MAIAFTSLTPAGSNKIRHFETPTRLAENMPPRMPAYKGYLIVERAILSRSDSKYKVTISRSRRDTEYEEVKPQN